MSRKSFITSHGATCRNWLWSWSFVNVSERIVIFRAWDKFSDGPRALVFDERWSHYSNGRKSPGYAQSREHIRLVEEEGFILETFRMLHSDARQDSHGEGPATIGGFEPNLSVRKLVRQGQSWYAE